MKGESKAYLLGIAAVLIWSTVASVFKVTLRHTDPLGMLLMASAVSTVVLFAAVFFTGRTDELRKLSGGSLIRNSLLGLLNPFFYYVVLFMAYSRLPAQEAQPLNYTWPIILSILSVAVLGQKIPARSFLAVIISFAGVVLISVRPLLIQGASLNIAGIVLALGSGVIWSVYWIINIKGEGDTTVSLLLNFSFGTLFIILASILFGADLTLEPVALLGSAYIGIFEMGITFIIWLTALKLTRNAARISNLIYLSPFLSLLFIHLIVGESIYVTTVIGLVLIVAGIGLQGRPSGKRDDSKINR